MADGGIEGLVRAAMFEAVQKQAVLAVRRQHYRVARDLTNAIVSVRKAGTVGHLRQIAAYAEGLKKNFGNPRDLERVNAELARKMGESVRRSYGQFRGKAGQYRVNGAGDFKKTTAGGFRSRYSGGSLKNALRHPDLVVGNASGIYFVDEGRLTVEAAHWARMNFGARGSRVPDRKRTRYALTLGGRQVTTIGFDVGSRPAFSVPPGVWYAGGSSGRVRVPADPRSRGLDQFFPSGSRALRRGKGPKGFAKSNASGIRNLEFLDAGLRRLAREFPKAYGDMMDKWMTDAGQQVPWNQNITAKLD